MSLSTNDAYTLENWFCELKLYVAQSDPYIALRNKIYTFIHTRLFDLLQTKTYEWSRRYQLSADDANSIFNDMLLMCVEKYTPKKSKFITYFWTACENQAKNYYKHYRRQRRIPPAQLVQIDFPLLSGDEPAQADEAFAKKSVLDQLKHMFDAETEKSDLTNKLTLALEDLSNTLTVDEQKVLQNLTLGGTPASIAKELNQDIKLISKHIRNIRKKAKQIL